jgi:hypothetical protein
MTVFCGFADAGNTYFIENFTSLSGTSIGPGQQSFGNFVSKIFRKKLIAKTRQLLAVANQYNEE